MGLGMSPRGKDPAHLSLDGSRWAFVCLEALGTFVFSWAELFTGVLPCDLSGALQILNLVCSIQFPFVQPGLASESGRRTGERW